MRHTSNAEKASCGYVRRKPREVSLVPLTGLEARTRVLPGKTRETSVGNRIAYDDGFDFRSRVAELDEDVRRKKRFTHVDIERVRKLETYLEFAADRSDGSPVRCVLERHLGVGKR